VDEKDILERISALVDEEHQLRGSSAEHDDEQRTRLTHVETQLDQCWDLLRQWRAKRQYGENPDDAHARPEQEVENYLQ
jgi:hypothetical protein